MTHVSTRFLRILAMIAFPVIGGWPARSSNDAVILLHGLLRSDTSMSKMASALAAEGYMVVNVDYPSRSATVETLSDTAIDPALTICRTQGVTQINFVTHSLGGILVRSYLSRRAIPELGRVVMLGPPNQGSEVVDTLGDTILFKWLNGPAGQELGTGTNSVPHKLGPVRFETGVIAGNHTINLINSLIIPGPDDGKVSVNNARIAGMKDFIVLPVSHPFIMKDSEVIYQTRHFLKTGMFDHELTNRMSSGH